MMPPIAHPIWIGRSGEDGLSGFTRYALPSEWCCTAGGLDLPGGISARETTAFHEAGHTLLALIQGVHVPAVRVSTEPGTSGCGHPQGFAGANENLGQQLRLALLEQALVVLAGGIRAETAWLGESGVEMTDTRSFAVEVGGLDDQVQARNLLACYGQQIEYGTGHRLRDYWCHQDTADLLLTRSWRKVCTLAAALLECNRLTGDQAAELIDLSNPPLLG
ncbi:hypothetical protein ACH4PR_41920 [Streptomyces mirabilis]|uniref:hypothetical protein n=1 Tax=Streptomyces mirabilis TaxID=68239 RepID=UPI0037B05134